ncbi:MAG: hypothetical protein HC888_18905, partial [Candidatus Competibacteraceae bacterium]|nr:hypothetical protein [Candidatus Competibacteraceae bacterium]
DAEKGRHSVGAGRNRKGWTARTALNGGPGEAVVEGAEGTVLDGFVFREDASTVATVRVKRAMTLSRCLFEAGSGSCIDAWNAEDLVLRRLRFERMESSVYTPMIQLKGSPRFLVEDCLFLENTGNPSLMSTQYSGDGRMNRVVFLRNALNSYLIYLLELENESCQPVIANSWFEDNPIVLASLDDGPIFVNSVFKSNQGFLAMNGQDYEKSDADGEWEPEGEECEGEPCSGNSCPLPEVCPTTFVHCTFVGNKQPDALLFNMMGTHLNLTNSVLFDNASFLVSYFCDPPSAGHTLFQANPHFSGTGNLVGEPGFMGPGNVRPGAGSVLLNAGMDISALGVWRGHDGYCWAAARCAWRGV